MSDYDKAFSLARQLSKNEAFLLLQNLQQMLQEQYLDKIQEESNQLDYDILVGKDIEYNSWAEFKKKNDV